MRPRKLRLVWMILFGIATCGIGLFIIEGIRGCDYWMAKRYKKPCKIRWFDRPSYTWWRPHE